MRIGRYELGAQLGEGGQGRVYEATLFGPAGLRRRVALKMLVGGGDGLQREARISGLLRHPNVVDVYEVGEHDGTWFMALERCDRSLEAVGPLSSRAVVDVGRQVCAALQYAHDALSLVHLDLKPANLLLRDGVVKVADLGIAHARGFDAERQIRGTPGYMAPEQALGKAVDARTDLYAVGICLLELATGRKAGASDTFDVELQLQQPEEERPDWLAPVVDRCLAVDPADRFQTAAELADALGALDVEGLSLLEQLGVPQRVGLRPSLSERPLVGRHVELDAIALALQSPGLITLKGPGGIGKTSLARSALRDWPHQGWFVDLTAARSEDSVIRGVGQAIGLPLSALGPTAAQVGWALAARGRGVLVLDNVEQLAGELGALDTWISGAPQLRILATSRVPTHRPGERVVEVGALSEVASLALFAARAADRGVELGEEPALVELVRRLAGIPLALELAAGRLGVLTVDDLLAHLELSWLRSGSSDVGDRHSTLEAALAWSWDLLTAHEQQAATQLAVFVAPFTPEAAEAVVELGADAPSVLDVLDGLADASLLTAKGTRLSMLEPVRQFVDVRLTDRQAASVRHGQLLAGWAARKGAIESHGSDDLFQVLVAEMPDVFAAVRRAIDRGDADVAVPGLLAAGFVVNTVGPRRALLPLLEEALQRFPDHRGPLVGLRSRVRYMGDESGAVEDASETVELARSTGDIEALSQAQIDLGASLWHAERFEESGRALREVLERPVSPWLEALTLHNLETAVRVVGNIDEALAILDRCLDLVRRHGFWRVLGPSLVTKATILAQLGRIAEAGEVALTAVEQCEGTLMEPLALNNAAILVMAAGDTERSLRLATRSLEAARRVGELEVVEHRKRHRGVVLLDLARFEEALALAEDTVWGREQRFIALLGLGRLEEAHAWHVRQPLPEAGAKHETELWLRRGDLAAANAVADSHEGDPWLVWLLIREGRAADALDVIPHRREMPPLPLESAAQAAALAAVGRRDEAERLLDQVGPWFQGPRVARAWYLLGRVVALGEAAARVELDELVDRLGLHDSDPLRRLASWEVVR